MLNIGSNTDLLQPQPNIIFNAPKLLTIASKVGIGIEKYNLFYKDVEDYVGIILLEIKQANMYVNFQYVCPSMQKFHLKNLILRRHI